MCGRFNMTADPLTRLFMALAGKPYPLDHDLLNVAPTEDAPVVHARHDGDCERDVTVMRWWLVPHWAKEVSTKYSMFNARMENITKSAAFKGPFARSRCVVPVSGFYEWIRRDDKKIPIYVVPDGDDGLCLAGVCEHWEQDGEEPIDSFAVVTTQAHPDLEWLHNRQPVMLRQEDVDGWLDPDADTVHLMHLCAPRLPVPLAAVETSTYVNNSRHKTHQVLEPVGKVRHVPASGTKKKQGGT